jgi:uncharacterized membrane-anchored protein YitT (DUF2179 family)
MKKIKQLKERIDNYMIDNPKLRISLRWVFLAFVCALSAFIFAFGFKAFINPPNGAVQIWKDNLPAGSTLITDIDVASPTHLISGGASGTSQVIVKIISCFVDVGSITVLSNTLESFLISVLYFVINIPLFILSWLKISKQFTVFTLINVGLTSLFMNVIPDWLIAQIINLYPDLLARAIFAGITTGVSSGICMAAGASCGGSDIITIFLSEKKSTTVGKYSLVLNVIIVFTYVAMSIIAHSVAPEWNQQDNNKVISSALYTVVYSFVSSKVIDIINIKNKKVEMQIFTSDKELSKVLVHAFPHTCTIVDSEGAFSGKRNFIVYMVISKSEKKKAIKLIKTADPLAFFTITDIHQVYGRFYIKPIE